MGIIEVKNLSFSYGDCLVLDNVNMSIPKGEVTAILGGNGAGKSTLFLNLNGVLIKDSGDVIFDGVYVDYKSSSLKELRRRVGIVFQDPNDQLFSASVRKDVSFGAINLGLSQEEVKARVEKALKDVQMLEYANSPTHALSFGQKKRVAIAGVLAMKPEVIILDEITAGLDPQGVSEILRLLVDIKDKTGVTIIIATHDIDIVPLYCDYVYVMNKGRTVMHGTPDKIFLERESLREYALRLPRISHLMEILKDYDNLSVDETISTISTARKAIKGLISGESFSIKKGKKLRRGYTTGSCAAAAAKAAAITLLTGVAPQSINIITPSNVALNLAIVSVEIKKESVICSVIKDSGDDPDVTNGVKIAAEVSKINSGIEIVGGNGVGVVTKRGLSCAVGSHAINPIPRKMIADCASDVIENSGYVGGLKVIISAENGEELAKHTFNERLSIVGGISILGTSGIVEPMSEKAIIDTIFLEIDSKIASGAKEILLCFGNYGRDFALNRYGVDLDIGVKCSNYIGEVLDYVVYKGVEKILLIGHAGKLIKLAGGVMNTHSKMADCRAEIFAAHAALANASKAQISQIMNAATTDEIDSLLNEFEIADEVWSSIIDKVKFHLASRLVGKVEFEVIIFTDKLGKVRSTNGADVLMNRFKEV